MPTLDPRFAGLTNTGYPSCPVTRAITVAGADIHSSRSTTRYFACGNPRAANTSLATALSMPTAEASTPAPTYGMLASSSSPCTVPSSPYGPCSTGKTTSSARPVIVGLVAALDRHDLFVARMRDQMRLASASPEPSGRIGAALLDHVGGRRRGRQPIGDHPAAVFLDADRDRLVTIFVEVLHDGGGRGDRDFVLARSAAVDDADAKFFHGNY